MRISGARSQVADGGAPIVAYGLLQCAVLDEALAAQTKSQLLRYCELDTFAMVMAWEALQELLESQPPAGDIECAHGTRRL